MSTAFIRPIEIKDNEQIASLIRSVLIDFGVPKIGTAYADKELDRMFETYEISKSKFYVIEDHGNIIGGAGIAPLRNYNGDVCELQKMYFSPEARGKGLGKTMLNLCIETAKEMGYKQCYLETMPYMEAAQKLYERFGFYYIDCAMGETGHTACPVHMLKDLQ